MDKNNSQKGNPRRLNRESPSDKNKEQEFEEHTLKLYFNSQIQHKWILSQDIKDIELIKDGKYILQEAKSQTLKQVKKIIEKESNKVKPIQVDIGEFDKFISCHDLNKELDKIKWNN